MTTKTEHLHKGTDGDKNAESDVKKQAEKETSKKVLSETSKDDHHHYLQNQKEKSNDLPKDFPNLVITDEKKSGNKSDESKDDGKKDEKKPGDKPDQPEKDKQTNPTGSLGEPAHLLRTPEEQQKFQDQAKAVHESMHPSGFYNPTPMANKDQPVIDSLNGKSKDELDAISAAYQKQYGTDMRQDMNQYLSEDGRHRADAILGGEKDPGYMSATDKESKDALNQFDDKIKSTKNPDMKLSDYVDEKDLSAIQKNEVDKRHDYKYAEDEKAKSQGEDSLKPTNSYGPASMQVRNYKSLRDDPTIGDQLNEKDPNTGETKALDPSTNANSQKYIAAYLDARARELDAGTYGSGEGNNPNARKQIQDLWNKGDKDSRREALLRTYNSGNDEQVNEVNNLKEKTLRNDSDFHPINDAKALWHYI